MTIERYHVRVPTLAETSADFIGPLNPHVGEPTRLAPGSHARINPGTRLVIGARAFVSSRATVRVHRHERGPRVYLAGRRVHHGPAFGLAAVLCWWFRWRTLATALGAYAATDWRDFPFTDDCNH